MSSPTDTWQDRRGMFQKGKAVHEPTSPTGRRFSETGSVSNTLRRASQSSNSGGAGGAASDKSPSGSSVSGTVFPTASGSGRRSSAASGGGLFGSLTNMKRGSEDYGERRASQTGMLNQGGVVSGWFNQTFKGYQKPAGSEETK